MRKEIKKLVTIVMAFTMVLSLPTVSPKANAAETQTAISDEQELKNIIGKYLDAAELVPTTDTEKLMVKKSVINPDPIELFEYSAWQQSAKTFKVIDINGDGVYEMVAGFSGNKVSVYEYDEVALKSIKKNLKPLKTIKNVKEIRYVAKKTITFKQVSGKKTTYTTYKMSSGKFKATTTYVKSGTTYSKNNKKIKKAAFNKYVKTYKKQKKLSLDKVSSEVELYTSPRDYNELHMEKNQAYGFMYHNSSSFVFSKNEGSAEDKYRMFLSCLNPEIPSIRYILGPDTKVPGKDYT